MATDDAHGIFMKDDDDDDDGGEMVATAVATAAVVKNRQKVANLTRVRNNQRRSRARKKEYVSELEEKYRACQQVGLEASTELQVAARAVLEENKRLKTLLQLHGIPHQMLDNVTAVQELERTLPSKRYCRADSNSTASSLDHKNSSPPTSSTQTTISFNLNQAVEQSFQNRPEIAYMQPTMVMSAMPTQHHPYAMSADGSVTSPTVSNLPMLYSSLSDSQSPSHSGMDTSIYQPMPHPPMAQPFPNFTTCSNAAGVLMSTYPHLDQDLDADLSCPPGSTTNCSVPNARVFELMDKYTWS